MLAQWPICFADVFSLFFYFSYGQPMSQVISETTGRTFKFSGLKDPLKGVINLAFIWQSLKGHCHDNQFYRQNWPTYLHLSHWHSEIDWSIEH